MKIEAGSRTFGYELDGPAGSPVIAFVHGLAASRAIWRRQAELLSDTYRVLRVDLRSHGESSAVDESCTRSDLANDLIAVMDALDVERAALVGHSAGGVVAMQTAVDHPSRVGALVLVGTASECNDKTADWYRATAAAAAERGGEAAMKALGMKSDRGTVPDGRGFAHVAHAMCTLNSDPLTERLRDLNVPVRILVGENDFLGVGGSVILSRAIEGSELDIVPERGHGIYLEAPEWFAKQLREFFARRFTT